MIVASTGTRNTDEVTKFNEYEQGGVKEYWTFDRQRHEARFYRLNEDGVYLAYREDERGNYETPSYPVSSYMCRRSGNPCCPTLSKRSRWCRRC